MQTQLYKKCNEAWQQCKIKHSFHQDGATTLSIVTFNITILNIIILFTTLIIYVSQYNDTQLNSINIMLSVTFFVTLRVITQNVVMLSVIILNLVEPVIH